MERLYMLDMTEVQAMRRVLPSYVLPEAEPASAAMRALLQTVNMPPCVPLAPLPPGVAAALACCKEIGRQSPLVPFLFPAVPPAVPTMRRSTAVPAGVEGAAE